MGNMGYVAAVKFHRLDMPRYYRYAGDVEIDDFYLCEDLENSIERVGYIAALESRCDCQLQRQELPRILREARPDEIVQWRQTKDREDEYLRICREKVRKHGLEMKVTLCRIDKKNNKIVFNFTADQRVDFRELVRDLAGALRSRIELWQIGVRDEAKLIDGVDVCGNQICCASWMRKFDPVTIKHARDQDIMRAPAKLAGLCGRLRCCLTFEHNSYLNGAAEKKETAAEKQRAQDDDGQSPQDEEEVEQTAAND